jgi:hypothetical protein
MAIDSRWQMDDVTIKMTDEDLEVMIRDRLHKNPLFYLNFLKELIDEIDEVIPDEVLFDLLQPSFPISGCTRKTEDHAHNETAGRSYDGPALSPSTESVDMLFRPGVRKKLYEWLCALFSEESGDLQKKTAKDNIGKVIHALMAEEKVGQDVLSKQDAEYNKVYKACKDIFARQNKTQRIKEYFPDVGQEIAREIDNGSLFITTPEKLRNVLLARRFKRRQESFPGDL